MRIKAVLRDTDILQLEAGSKERIIAAAKKNADRVINWPSLLKVMGLIFEERTKMLEALAGSKMSIWLLTDGNQDLIFLSEGKETPPEDAGYKWQ
ncbi:MAG: hypothetical protein RTU63_00050 [Candidatus Thorarchaeota archaeon]